MPIRISLILLLNLLFGASYSQLQINEVMSSNTNTIIDEDNDDPDWFELYNSGDESVALGGLILSDSNNQWVLPQMELASKQYLLVFASGKDKKNPPSSWNTIIDWGDTWKYIVPTAQTPSNWYQQEFDDSSWLSGNSGFGYGDGDDNTQLENVMSVFLRKDFEIESLSSVNQLVLHMDFDDAFVAYINGTEIARENINTTGVPAYNHPADDYDHEAQMYQGLAPNTFEIQNPQNILQEGSNTIAIQVHNHTTGSSDLTAIPFLSIGTSSGENNLSEHLSAIQTNLHTNFELKADGETLLLLSPENELIDSVTIPKLATDISIGRIPDGTGSWHYFSDPTPGKANNTTGFTTQSGEVTFSLTGGVYSSSQQLSLSSNATGDQIYYTLDGSLPSVSGMLYSSPITISKTTSVRAQVINENALPGPIETHTFLIQKDHDLPVVSITTAPKNLWDEEEGIYVLGNNAEADNPYFGANFWEDWEKPVHFELIETNGEIVVSQDVGMRIFGGWSRANAQKSFSLHARKSFGSNTISYKIFDDLELDEFSSIVLRNSGNDWNNTMFRDAFLTSQFHPSVDKQAYQPAVVYINGEYWGIQNIREKVNEDFLASHHDLHPDSIIILEANATPVEGDESSYLELMDFIENNDLSNEENYEYVASKIDIQNFIFYQTGNIFIDNKDWPGNNIKYWKHNDPESKWRWITYDTDFGFAIWGEDPNFNTLNFALDPGGPGWPNPPWSTLFLRKLIENNHFKQQFVNAFCDQFNTTWQTNNVTNTINEMSQDIESEIGSHMNRWGSSFNQWRNQVDRMKEYAQVRPGNVINHISNRFNLGSQQTITVTAKNEEGHVRLNTLNLKSFPWSGKYFEEMPIELEAIPQPGYQFVRWQGAISSNEAKVSFKVTNSNMEVEAIFEQIEDNRHKILINEICYVQTENFDSEDWVELYNSSTKMVDLTGWLLKDNDDSHQFMFPNIQLEPGAYLVICRDENQFNTLLQGISTTGSFDFGLSGEDDCVRIFDDTKDLIDEVCYNENWPIANPGQTLGLISPELENDIAQHWLPIDNNGSPGSANPNASPLFLQKTITPIFPNPITSDFFKVRLSDHKSIVLINMKGVETELSIDEGNTDVRLPDSLPNGLYFLKIKQNKKTFIQKVIISR